MANSQLLINIGATLGVPGVIMIVFYLLFNKVDIKLSKISRTWSPIIALAVYLCMALLIAWGLWLWSPVRARDQESKSESHRSAITNKRLFGYLSSNGMPLPNASVRLVDAELSTDDTPEVITDLNGRFSFESLKVPQGISTVTVVFKKEGFETYTIHLDLLDSPHRISLPSLDI